jgi:hypothetical protein
VDDVVERIMSFDKNKDGKVTRDELPERMHHLIALGDTNKDGALDRAEIKKLASRLSGAPEGLDAKVAFGPVGRRRIGGPLLGPGADHIEGVIDDLKLPGKKNEQAKAVVKAHQENVRKLMEQARADLLQKMKQVLSAEELEDFKAALDRPRGAFKFAVGPGGAPRPGGAERKLELRQPAVSEPKNR